MTSPIFHASPAPGDVVVPCCGMSLNEHSALLTAEPSRVTCPGVKCPGCEGAGKLYCRACHGDGDARTFTPPCPECGHDTSIFLRKKPLVECVSCGFVHARTLPPPRAEHTRATLHARIADVLRRSGVEDAERLVMVMERDAAEVATCLALGSLHASERAGDRIADGLDAHSTWRDAARIDRALSGHEIGPPKPAASVESEPE